MLKDDFANEIIAMEQTLYRVSYGLLRSEADREDAMQECILSAWEKRDTLRNEAYFRTWVVRILINKCHDIQRKNSRFTDWELVPEQVAPDVQNRELHDAILRLDEKHRLPLMLHYIEGFELKEIAQMLRMPLGTVKSRLHHGRNQLRRYLGEEVWDYA